EQHPPAGEGRRATRAGGSARGVERGRLCHRLDLRHGWRPDTEPGAGRVIAISVEAIEPLTFDRAPPLSAMDVLSPCVWQEEDGYQVLLRAVNHADDPANKIARIYHGHGHDGLRFRMDAQPVIAPSIDASADDAGGCEDPSVARYGGRYHVCY